MISVYCCISTQQGACDITGHEGVTETAMRGDVGIDVIQLKSVDCVLVSTPRVALHRSSDASMTPIPCSCSSVYIMLVGREGGISSLCSLLCFLAALRWRRLFGFPPSLPRASHSRLIKDPLVLLLFLLLLLCDSSAPTPRSALFPHLGLCWGRRGFRFGFWRCRRHHHYHSASHGHTAQRSERASCNTHELLMILACGVCAEPTDTRLRPVGA